MQQLNCKCLACGKQYYFCLACNQQKKAPLWHRDFCDETCKTVFETVSDYNTGSYTKEEVAQKLKECDLTKNFKPSLKEKIREIQKTDKASFSDKKENSKPYEKKGFVDSPKSDKTEE